jgi:hypothetical protein
LKASGPAGWVYVLTHPAWERISLVKIGMTSRDPTKRAAEITSVSGLIAPCKVAWCIWVEDRAEVERTVKRVLRRHRVKQRELFRTDVETAKAAILAASCRKAPAHIPLPRRALPAPPPPRSLKMWLGLGAMATAIGLYLAM